MAEITEKTKAPLNCQEKRDNLPNRILCLSLEYKGLAFSLESSTKDYFSIGRSGECDFVIPHPSVSGRHCVIRRTEEDGESIYRIEDSKSTNGILLNGFKIPPNGSVLSDGDVVCLGQMEFLYKARGTKNLLTTQKTVVSLTETINGGRVRDLINFSPFSNGYHKKGGIAIKTIIIVSAVLVSVLLSLIGWLIFIQSAI
jgi:hypothetical protein